jgi:hypothetical protein
MITTMEEFDSLLREEHAVLFVFFDWSGQAHISLRVFKEWEGEWRNSHPGLSVGFYRLDPDRYKDAGGWLSKQAREKDGAEGGCGSVTWLRLGKRIGFVNFAAKVGKDKLSQLTDEFFGSTTAS